jgi:hypothetical protein
MSAERDEELEALLREFAPSAGARAELLEAHRLLEHDLSRLADPAPPRDFVQLVMKKVAAEPVRPLSRADMLWATGIFLSLAGAAAAMFFSSGASVGQTLGGLLVATQTMATGVSTVLQMVWRTAAGPLAVGLSLAVMMSVMGIRRLAVAGEKVAS